MRADIHYGQEHQSSTHGPDTDVQDQYPSVAHIGLATHGRSIQIGSRQAAVNWRCFDTEQLAPRPIAQPAGAAAAPARRPQADPGAASAQEGITRQCPDPLKSRALIERRQRVATLFRPAQGD